MRVIFCRLPSRIGSRLTALMPEAPPEAEAAIPSSLEPLRRPPLCPDGRKRLPAGRDAVLDFFLAFLESSGISLYPAQEEAILEIFDGKNIILNTPTGSGKSLVATAMHFKALCERRRSYYTSPIKALVNEKFLALCRDFGADQVGLVTGDATVNPSAPIVCATAEILANIALVHGAQAEVDDVIMDEFHYYSDRDRGGAWQVPLLTLSRSRFLLMSATLGETEFFSKVLENLTGVPAVLVHSVERPVPLEFRWIEEGLEHAVEELAGSGQAPVYVVHFSQRSAAESSKKFLSLNFLSKDEKREIQKLFENQSFRSPYGKEIKRLLSHGVGLHHAGLLPRYRLLVEVLAQRGFLKVICGTDTLGVGINVPIRTVLFTQLCKYDGRATKILTARDFHQVAGRAGRKGFDDRGLVAALPPPHVIENLKMDRRVAADPTKKRKIVRKKAPKGMVPWDEKTFQKLIESPPEALVSSFSVGHGMLLQVLGRKGEDGCAVMRHLIRDSHESAVSKQRHTRRAWQLFRSLVDHRIVEILPSDHAEKLRINVELQDDFSMHQTLSLWLVNTLDLLDRESESYPLDVVTLVESILEDPATILRKQEDQAKGDLLARLKNEGVPYEERMLRLEEVEHPKPLREFVYDTFNDFAAKHPWVGDDNIRPKSIAREMVESLLDFHDYVRRYGLQRVEGVLLRHLSRVYKVLSHTVPDARKTEELHEVEIFLESQVRGTDSSLLDEWEMIGHPEAAASGKRNGREDLAAARPYDLTADEKVFRVRVRNAAFQATRALAQGRYDELREILGQGGCPPDEELSQQTGDFVEAFGPPDFSSAARVTALFRFREDDGAQLVEQVLCAEGGEATEFGITYQVDLSASRAQQRAVLVLRI